MIGIWTHSNEWKEFLFSPSCIFISKTAFPVFVGLHIERKISFNLDLAEVNGSHLHITSYNAKFHLIINSCPCLQSEPVSREPQDEIYWYYLITLGLKWRKTNPTFVFPYSHVPLLQKHTTFGTVWMDVNYNRRKTSTHPRILSSSHKVCNARTIYYVVDLLNASFFQDHWNTKCGKYINMRSMQFQRTPSAYSKIRKDNSFNSQHCYISGCCAILCPGFQGHHRFHAQQSRWTHPIVLIRKQHCQNCIRRVPHTPDFYFWRTNFYIGWQKNKRNLKIYVW